MYVYIYIYVGSQIFLHKLKENWPPSGISCTQIRHIFLGFFLKNREKENHVQHGSFVSISQLWQDFNPLPPKIPENHPVR